MKILRINGFKDGGTIEITTDKEIYCVDNRIRSKTKGSVFEGYPLDGNSNILSNQNEIKLELIELLKDYDFNEFETDPTELMQSNL